MANEKQIVKRTKNGVVQYFGTHTDAVQFVDGNTKHALTDYVVTHVTLETNQQDNKKYLLFKNSADSVVYRMDATELVKDGMLQSVSIITIGGKEYLHFDFNTASGVTDIDIPLSDIFDSDLYYTKTEVNEEFNLLVGQIENGNVVAGQANDVNYPLPTDAEIANVINEIEV